MKGDEHGFNKLISDGNRQTRRFQRIQTPMNRRRHCNIIADFLEAMLAQT